MVKPGFKLTEVGEIPEDWEVLTIGDFDPFVTSGSRGWAQYYAKSGAPFVRITNLTRDRVSLDLSDLRFVQLPQNNAEGGRTALINGDILISITADIGICGFVDERLHKPAYINQHISLVRFKAEEVNSRFVSYFLASDPVQRTFVASSDTGAKAGMNLNGIRSIQLAKPSHNEQNAIAESLSDTDELIEALEKLIAKKRDIKTATMQQLLTGKKRLPGFGEGKGTKQTELGEIPEDWGLKQVGDLLKIRHGKSQKGVEETNGAYPIMATGGEIGRSSKALYSKPSVLIGRKGTIDIPYYMEAPFWTVDTLFYSEVSDCSDAKFLFYKFCLIDWYQYNETSGVPSLNAATIEKIEQAVPNTKTEQTAISTTISDFDSEIDTLETRLTKTKAIKQGMMQELLTGRTRLI